MYNYSEHFNLGLSVNYSYSFLMASIDWGTYNDSKGHYITKQIADERGSYINTKTSHPDFFVTLTPSFRLKYFSIGCGMGIQYWRGNDYLTRLDMTAKGSGSASLLFNYPTASSSAYITDINIRNKNRLKRRFMIRPTIKGFIPLTARIQLSLSAGYDCAFKELSDGFNGGLGIQFIL